MVTSLMLLIHNKLNGSYKMKKIIILFLSLVIATSFLISQGVENLTDDQKIEYNKRKLTVEKALETSNGMLGFLGIKINTWRAFRGLTHQIENEEFFRITGYDEEANEVKKTLKDANSKELLGKGLSFISAFGHFYQYSVDPNPKYGPNGPLNYRYNPTLTDILGVMAGIGGMYLMVKGKLMKQKPVAPYQLVSDIADEYNKNLIAVVIQSNVSTP